VRKLVIPLMRTASPHPAEMANQAPAERCTKSATDFGILQRLAIAIKTAWPRKSEAHVAHFTGRSERAVQFWLSASTRMSVEDVAALLRTEEGFLILDAIMGDDCGAEWWIVTKNAHDIRATRKMIDAAQRKLDAIRHRQQDLFDQK